MGLKELDIKSSYETGSDPYNLLMSFIFPHFKSPLSIVEFLVFLIRHH